MAFIFIILFLYWPLPIKLQYLLVKCVLPVVGSGEPTSETATVSCCLTDNLVEAIL